MAGQCAHVAVSQAVESLRAVLPTYSVGPAHSVWRPGLRACPMHGTYEAQKAMSLLGPPGRRRALTSTYSPVTACPSWLWQSHSDLQADTSIPYICLGSGGVELIYANRMPAQAVALASVHTLCGLSGLLACETAL